MNKKSSLGIAVILLSCIAVGVVVSQKGNQTAATDETIMEHVEVPEQFAGMEYMALALEQLQNATSFQGEFRNVFGSETLSGGEEETVTEAMISMVLEPFMIGMQESTNYGAINQISSIYLEEGSVKDGVQMINAYMNYGTSRSSEWTEMSVTEEGAHRFYDIYDGLHNMIVLLEYGTNWVEVSEKNDVYTVEGDIPAEDVYTVVTEGNFFKLGGMSGIDEIFFEDVEAVHMTLTIGVDGTPLSYELDLTDGLNAVIQTISVQMYGEEVNLTAPTIAEYRIEQKITSLNGLNSIMIPEEAKEAINYEEEIALMAANESAHTEKISEIAEEIASLEEVIAPEEVAEETEAE
ncbi:hypothetical protein [Chakrabartyella piscis]|uniref:hypothetical protein n=1 Tax=Chakrabartyella piscis TaxID=2918914 RepID=UPI0029589D62|nr:hypothetical protein [Chakrabartyella piscis]